MGSREKVIGDVCRVLHLDAKHRKVTLHLAPRENQPSTVAFILTDSDGTEYRLTTDQVLPVLKLFERID